MSIAVAEPTTPTSAPTLPVPNSGGEPPFWPISIPLYFGMIEAGLLPDKEPVYLWDGRLAVRKTINRPHSYCVTRTHHALFRLSLAGYFPEAEQPMAFRFAQSVPQPDVKVVRGRLEDFSRIVPTTADVPLVIEVSETSLAADRRLAASYATEGIPVYGIVNIPGRRVEVFTEPAEGAYTRCTPFGPDDDVPVVIDGREVGSLRVRDLMPE